jgi:hypothetical protein
MADFPACIWCNAYTMDWNASFNGKDICNDCEEDAVEVDNYSEEDAL